MHVHNGDTTAPWFISDDCYYGNCIPSYGDFLIWDPNSPMTEGGNPALDVDNTNANGPENLSINEPVIGEPYRVAVHNYSSAAGRNPTVEIYCGGGSVPVQTINVPMLNGTDTGDCTANDFWKLVDVVFTAPGQCSILPLNVLVPSSAACANY